MLELINILNLDRSEIWLVTTIIEYVTLFFFLDVRVRTAPLKNKTWFEMSIFKSGLFFFHTLYPFMTLHEYQSTEALNKLDSLIRLPCSRSDTHLHRLVVVLVDFVCPNWLWYAIRMSYSLSALSSLWLQEW